MTSLPDPTATPPAPTLRERFGRAMVMLIQMIGTRCVRDRSLLPEVLMAHGRLQSLTGRFQSLLLRIAAGTIRAPRGIGAARECCPRPAVAAQVPQVPRQLGWLVRGDGPESDRVRWAAAQLGLVLNDAETLALLAAAPRQAGRIVRPLCHALRLDVPEALRLPPRAKRKTKAKPKPGRRAGKTKARAMPARLRRMPSADWPRHVVGPGETVPKSRRRRRSD